MLVPPLLTLSIRGIMPKMSRESGVASNHLVTAMRVLLTLSWVPVCLVAVYALLVGITFGFNLWNPREPMVTVVWLAIVTSPAWFYGLLVWSDRSARRTVALFAIVATALVAGAGHYITH
jgi:hypothetical protein